MKIVHFSWEFPPVMFGGLGEHVVELTREQVRQGHDVVIITQQSHPRSKDCESIEGVRVIRVDNAYPWVPFTQECLDQWAYGFALASLSAAEQLIEDWNPDVIHAHDWLGSTQAQIFADRHNIPHVVTFHATEFGRHQGWLASRISRVIFAREQAASHQACKVIVCSSYMRGELTHGLGVDSHKIHVVANGVSRNSSGNTGQSIVEKTGFAIGFLGRLEWEKGAHHVIDALKHLPAENFRIEIIGTGSQLESLQEKVQRNNFKERVQFHGFVSAKEKQDLLKHLDVLVIPSSYEPFGIVALEAAAAGIPLITAQTGGLIDIVPDNSFGYQLTEINGAEIARHVLQISEHPSEAVNRSMRLMQRLETDFTWEAIVRATDFVYQQAMSLGVGASGE